jgi:hypothetical protein
VAEMIEHHRQRYAHQQTFQRDNLLGIGADLDAPAQIIHPPGERLDHVNRSRTGNIEVETNVADAEAGEPAQFSVADARVNDSTARAVGPISASASSMIRLSVP